MTRLINIQEPVHPIYQQQGPDSNCIIDGKQLGWDSCTAYSMAMLINRASYRKKGPSGCSVRRFTGDTLGGLNLNQVASVAEINFDIRIDVRTGPNAVRPEYVAQQVRAGRPAVIQGDAIAFVGTPFQSTGGAVAHAIELDAVRGGTIESPAEGLIYDPAADGELHSWGRADKGPSWIPWSLVKKFMASLRPTPGGPMIGSWCYVAFGPDTEPHVFLVPGAHKSSPFPDRTRAKYAKVWVHSNRKKGADSRVYGVSKGTLLIGYQYATGDLYRGSNIWLGNDDGTEWIHSKNLEHFNGDT